MCKQAALRAALLGTFAGLMGPAGASALVTPIAPAPTFTPPVLYIRQVVQPPAAVLPWTALSATSPVTSMGPYEIGYAAQASNVPGSPPAAALQLARVPDGRPPQVNTNACSVPDTPGAAIVAAGEVAFEGDGVYGIRVFLGSGPSGSQACLSGPGSAITMASFTVAAVTAAPVLVGRPMVFRIKPLTSQKLVGMRAVAVPGGTVATQCALNATVKRDGSVAGDLIAYGSTEIEEDLLKRPGAWTCVAHTTVEGFDDQMDMVTHSTPWSAPLHADVRSDFERRAGMILKPHSRRPRFRFTAEFPDAAAGGKVTLRFARLAHCRLQHATTFSGRFNARTATVTVKVPRIRLGPVGKILYYVGTLSFRGTRFYTKSNDPNPFLVKLTSDGLSYVTLDDRRPCVPRRLHI